MSTLDAQLLTAHAAGDKAALVALYRQAGDAAVSQDEAAFFLTNAYIYALEIGHADADTLRARLVAMGREQEA
ncbi:MAG: hypothetical protein COC12_07460 [Rhodobacteraceae bacterium]|nr:MAG: hypothetical protein COC12_07460 [Paracoccaceae bacterium]